jgi:hypothetical protein
MMAYCRLPALTNNPQALIMKTAELYSSVYDYLQNEAIPTATKKAGIKGNVPNDLITYAKQVQDKSNDMLRLANGYVSGTGPQNPDSYGVYIQTNPDNGLPISIKIQPVSSLDTSMSGYKITNNVTYGGLPVYLNTVQGQNGEEYGAIASGDGNTVNKFILNPKTGGGSGMLEGQAPEGKSGFLGIGGGTGFLGWGGAATGAKELDWSGIKNFGADYVGIPANSVLRDTQNNYYYIDNQGNNSKATNKYAMETFLQKNGQADKIKSAYLVNSDFLNAHPWQVANPDGTTKNNVISDGYSGGLVDSKLPIQGPPEPPKNTSSVPAGPTSPIGFTGNFKSSNQTATPATASLTKEKQPKEVVGGQYDFKATVSKAAGFFKSLIPKF